MKTQTTYKRSAYHFFCAAMLFTCMLLSVRTFSQTFDYKPTVILSEKWTDQGYQNSSKVTNTYDPHNFLISTLVQKWDSVTSSYVNDVRINYTNNINGTPDLVIYQSWNTSTNAWDDSVRITNTYNGAGKVLTTITEYWVVSLSNWQPISKVSNTYDGGGHLTNSLTQGWDVYSSSFTSSSQINYTYNANGTLNFSIEQKWNSTTNLWENFEMVSNTYNASNKILVSTTADSINGNWVNSSRNINSYDISGYLINEQTQKWDTTSSIWKNDSQSNISNNGSGMPTQVVLQKWSDALNIYVNDTRDTLFYGPLGIADFGSGKSFAVYPVPAYDRITIKANDNVQGLNYFIADETGRVFKRGTLDLEETTIDVNQLSAGVYFCQIGQDRNQTVKIIKK